MLEQGGFTPMSGSNTMCAVAGAFAAGLLPPSGPVLDVTIDTAVGPVTARAGIEDGKVAAVTVANVPAYVVSLDTPLEVPELGTVPVDVVFGGQFFVQAAAADCGLRLDPDRARDLVRAGALLRIAAREQLDVRHPLNPDVAGVSLVMLHSGAAFPATGRRATPSSSPGIRCGRTARRPGPAILDRSPCGTGTCARMAALHARGRLALGQAFDHHSILGSRFTGRLTGITDVAGIPAVRPTITGRTWITGRARWSLDPGDPYPARLHAAGHLAPVRRARLTARVTRPRDESANDFRRRPVSRPRRPRPDAQPAGECRGSAERSRRRRGRGPRTPRGTPVRSACPDRRSARCAARATTVP